MLHHLRAFFQRADLADARDVSAVPLDTEVHALVGIESTCVHWKLRRSHNHSAPGLRLNLNLSGHLLQIENNEFGRLKWSKPDPDVNDAQVFIVVSGRFSVALYKIGVLGSASLESALPKEIVHKSPHIESDLGPKWFVIR